MQQDVPERPALGSETAQQQLTPDRVREPKESDVVPAIDLEQVPVLAQEAVPVQQVERQMAEETVAIGIEDTAADDMLGEMTEQPIAGVVDPGRGMIANAVTEQPFVVEVPSRLHEHMVLSADAEVFPPESPAPEPPMPEHVAAGQQAEPVLAESLAVTSQQAEAVFGPLEDVPKAQLLPELFARSVGMAGVELPAPEHVEMLAMGALPEQHERLPSLGERLLTYVQSLPESEVDELSPLLAQTFEDALLVQEARYVDEPDGLALALAEAELGASYETLFDGMGAEHDGVMIAEFVSRDDLLPSVALDALSLEAAPVTEVMEAPEPLPYISLEFLNSPPPAPRPKTQVPRYAVVFEAVTTAIAAEERLRLQQQLFPELILTHTGGFTENTPIEPPDTALRDRLERYAAALSLETQAEVQPLLDEAVQAARLLGHLEQLAVEPSALKASSRQLLEACATLLDALDIPYTPDTLLQFAESLVDSDTYAYAVDPALTEGTHERKQGLFQWLGSITAYIVERARPVIRMAGKLALQLREWPQATSVTLRPATS